MTLATMLRAARARENTIAFGARQATRRLLGPDIPPAVDALLFVGFEPGRWHPTLRDLAARLGRNVSTTRSVFHRAAARHGLGDDPGAQPSVLLASCFLVRAAAVLEDPGLSASRAADVLGAPSPQSFGRTVRTRTGQPVAAWRTGRTGQRELDTFLRELEILRSMLVDVRLWPRRHDAAGAVLTNVTATAYDLATTTAAP